MIDEVFEHVAVHHLTTDLRSAQCVGRSVKSALMQHTGLEQHMLPPGRRLFQGPSKRVQVQDSPVCSPHLTPIENVWH